MGIIPALSLLAGGFCLLFGLIPLLFYGIFHVGVAALLILGGLLVLLPLLWKRLAKSRPLIMMRRALFLAAGASIAASAAFSIPMAYAAYGNPPGDNATVVVLGCKVEGDSPSLMLRRRLDAALPYLQSYPEAQCVVAGGQGENEDYTEAYVMRKYLVEQGIDPSRIHMENRSTDTRENLLYTWDLLGGEDRPIAIATDGFHQMRGRYYGKSAGFTQISALPSPTPWGLLPSYWVREFFGLLVAWLFY